MKNVCLFAACLCVLACLAPATARADKKNGPRYKVFDQYDKNKNGVIDGDEKEAMRKDFAAKPDGDLKRFDTNKDGKLDDAEIAAIKPPEDKKKTGKTKSGSTDKSAKTDETAKPADSAAKTTTDDAAKTTTSSDKKP